MKCRNVAERSNALKYAVDFVPLQVFKLGLHPVERNILCVGEIIQELQILILQVAVPCKHKMT